MRSQSQSPLNEDPPSRKAMGDSLSGASTTRIKTRIEHR